MKKYKKEKTKIWYQKAFDLISNALKKYLIKKQQINTNLAI